MADLSDVENALVALVSASLYPSGTSSPSLLGVDAQVYRGWPKKADLDRDLAAGKVTVTVYPRPTERNTTRFPRDWQEQVSAAPTLTASVAANVVTLGGTVTAANYVTVLVGGTAYSYAALATDSLDDIAAALQALVQVDVPAAAAGATLTINTSLAIIARVGAPGSSWMEIRRQQRQFQITFWCPTPTLRDVATKAVDPVLADLNFLTLADGSAGRLIYVSSAVMDGAQASNLYRRDLIYSIEYPTSQTETDYAITSISEAVQGGVSPADSPIFNSGI